jgi:hypothetical protein
MAHHAIVPRSGPSGPDGNIQDFEPNEAGEGGV